MERPDPNPIPVAGAQRLESRDHSLPELLRRSPVERDGADRLGRRPAVHEPGDAGDERGRLAAARRRDAKDRTRWRRGGGTLIWGKPSQALHHGRMHTSKSGIGRSSTDLLRERARSAGTTDS